MSLLRRLLYSLGLAGETTTRQFELDEGLHTSLLDLAALEQRPVEELAADLLQQAVGERRAALVNLRRWRGLSPRQQDVAALVCLNYTNQQIAVRLRISPETVKTHVRNLLGRYGVRSKAELRQCLADWDFSAWK